MIAILSLVGIGGILTLVRLLKGPTTMDRIVSVDTLNIMITGLIGIFSITFKNSLYLDIAIVYGVLSFLETIILAKYMEGKS